MAAARVLIDALDAWVTSLADDATAEPSLPLAALEQALIAAVPVRAPAVPAGDDLAAKLRAAFEVEHKEHLEGIRGILAGLGSGAPAPGQIDEAFRRAHSLKGAARIAELRPVEALAHRLETLFARVREKTLELGPEVVRAIHLGLDAIEDAAASTDRPPRDAAPPLDAIEQALGTGTADAGARVEPSVERAPPSRPTSAPPDTVRVGCPV